MEQAILLEEKLALHYSLLIENQTTINKHSTDVVTPGFGVETFLSNLGSYKDLVTDNCDTVEIWKRVLLTVQEISQLASILYAAVGLPLSRSFSSVGERQSDAYVSPILPKRAETFGGFDERRGKVGNTAYNHSSHHRGSGGNVFDTTLSNYTVVSTTAAAAAAAAANQRDNHQSDISRKTYSIENVDGVNVGVGGGVTNIPVPESGGSSDKSNNGNLKDYNLAALQVTHNLQLMLSIIQQQMTTIESLQTKLNNKTIYRHNDQLEELRNLQDKLQEEKTAWLKSKEAQERDIEERRIEQNRMQEQIRTEQEDIKQQREQLYRKMEILSSQGLLISPSVAIPMNVSNQQDDNVATQNQPVGLHTDDHFLDGNDRRKDKWKTSTSTFN